jgi:hypothetical protein
MENNQFQTPVFFAPSFSNFGGFLHFELEQRALESPFDKEELNNSLEEEFQARQVPTTLQLTPEKKAGPWSCWSTEEKTNSSLLEENDRPEVERHNGFDFSFGNADPNQMEETACDGKFEETYETSAFILEELEESLSLKPKARMGQNETPFFTTFNQKHKQSSSDFSKNMEEEKSLLVRRTSEPIFEEEDYFRAYKVKRNCYFS